MKVIDPNVEVLTPLDGEYILKFIKKCSDIEKDVEEEVTYESAMSYVSKAINNGDDDMLRHFGITVMWTCGMNTAYKLGFSPEYVYKAENEVVKQSGMTNSDEVYNAWFSACKCAENAFNVLCDMGVKEENARVVLPECLKTNIVITMNLLEWREFLKQNCDIHAEPNVRLLALKTLRKFCLDIPVVFNGI